MTEDQDDQSPWTRGGFIGAAVIIAVIVILGIILAVTLTMRSLAEQERPDPTPVASDGATITSPEPSTPPAAAGGSVCGLEGEELEGSLATAPDAEWQYQGTTAYPTSATFGPGETSDDGARFCFQRSPAGALFMAANAFTQGSDPELAAEWVDYAVAEGGNRTDLVANMGSASGDANSRTDLIGFRLLAYDGDSARVDLAVRGTFDGTTVTVSGVYELVWQGGDWKISSDVAEPLNVAAIPDAAGYIAWGA